MREYRPVMPESEWAVIGPFVRDVVARASPLVTYDARELYPAVTRLAEFLRGAGLPLEDDVAFDPAILDRFTQFKLQTYNRASRNTMRARLRRVSEALLGEDTAHSFRTLGKANAARPYTPKEVTELRAWSQAHRTSELRTSAGALLALGLGAGLTGAEIIEQRIEDVDDAAITVSRDRRVVMVTDRWRDDLAERRGQIGSTGWAFRADQRGGNVNLITDFVSRSRPAVNLQTRRMRATWLVQHLEAGTPLKTLLRTAGLQSAESLDRVLPFVTETHTSDCTLSRVSSTPGAAPV